MAERDFYLPHPDNYCDCYPERLGNGHVTLCPECPYYDGFLTIVPRDRAATLLLQEKLAAGQAAIEERNA